MNDRLVTYLHDHLAGSHFAINLLDSLHDQYRNEELGTFASAICGEIREDQSTLQKIIDRVGKRPIDLTEMAGWLSEKASRFKLSRDKDNVGLGTFEALETLELGIKGKSALWRALEVIGEFDTRVRDFDFKGLAARADEQYARVDEYRLKLAGATFGSVEQ
jgi:hypothetical protein